MAVKKKVIINERGRFACQAYIESATALSDIEILDSVCSELFKSSCDLKYLFTGMN